VTFTYDYRNRRVRKLVEEYDGSSWSETLDRKFVWYNWLLLAELDGEDDSVVKKYTWGADLSGQNGNVAASPRGGRLEAAGGIGGLLATRDEADSKSYVHFYDGNGNVTQMIDRSDESTAAHYEYDAYANNLLDLADPNQSGPYAAENPIRFSTKYWDDETGLGYWGYRYYSAGMGRWLSRDPIGEVGGIHTMAFAINDPANLLDVDGLATVNIRWNVRVAKHRDQAARARYGRAEPRVRVSPRWGRRRHNRCQRAH
jgi:RHS repeat-associated protein